MVLLIGVVVGFVTFGCWIWTIITAFKHGETAIGILSLCPLIGFIMGWVKASEWNHMTCMGIWSVCLVINFGLQAVNGMAAAGG